jgi:hypothetical protein
MVPEPRLNSISPSRNRSPAPKHAPHQNTLKTRPTPPPRCAINSSNQVVSTRQWPQFKEGSLLIMLMQLGSSSVTIALSPGESVASRSQRRKRIHSGTNALLSSKRRCLFIELILLPIEECHRLVISSETL